MINLARKANQQTERQIIEIPFAGVSTGIKKAVDMPINYAKADRTWA